MKGYLTISGKPSRRANAGFSLIELLVVVAIILVVAAISIPNLLRSRIAANEATAVANLRTITTAQVAYLATYANGFAPAFMVLGPTAGVPPTCDNAGFIDDVLALSQKNGYTFIYAGASPQPAPASGCSAAGFNAYSVQANPLSFNATGVRTFFVDQSGIIRYRTDGTPASVTDPPLN